MWRIRRFLLAAVVGPALLLTSNAGAARIDFESFDLSGGLYLDVAETLVFNNVEGSGVNVTILGSADNRVYDVFQYGGDTQATGQALIDWPWPDGSNTAGTTILFDQPISAFTLRAGDFGNDDDSPLKISIYNGGDVLIGTTTLAWPASADAPFGGLGFAGTDIRKVVYSSGGAYANSTFIDDIQFTPANAAPPIPAPGALLLGGMGMGVVGWLRQRRTL